MNRRRMAWGAVFTALLAAAAAAAPANALPAALDTDTPEFRAVAEAYSKARQEAEETRKARLRELIKVQLDEANAMLKEKKQVGNVKGIAIAAQAKQIFDSALTNLDATGTFTVPDKVRKELDEMLTHFNGVRARTEAAAADALAAIEKDHFARFTAVAARVNPELAGPAAEPALKAAFAAAVARLAAPPPPPPPATGTNAPPASGLTNAVASTNAAAAPRTLPEILGESGSADRWVTAARVLADMRGMDVLEIPLVNRPAGTNVTDKFNPITQLSSDIRYVSIYPLPARTGLVYRLKRVPDREGVEVVRWPDSRNDYTLEVRTTPSVRYPCPHGFEIQIGGPDALLAAIFSGAPMEVSATRTNAAPAKIEPAVITLNTQPAGAGVWLNDKPMRDLRTPCRFRLPPDTSTIRVALPGYVDGVFSNLGAAASRTLTWTFKPDPRIVRTSMVIAANATNWTGVVTVQPGARIAVDAQGSWSCLDTPCGPEGYPNNEANYRVYMNPAEFPRQASTANYGALIWRIGPKGRASAFGRSLRLTAQEAGELQFDINMSPDPQRRAGNSGNLTVSVVVLPPP